MTYEQIIAEAGTSKWQPEFVLYESIDAVADAINRPHEDYPIGVQATIDMILLYRKSDVITFADACNIQKYLFDVKVKIVDEQKLTLPNLHINLGLRQTEVKVGGWVPPHPLFLSDFVRNLFPVYSADWKSLVDWYKQFQTVHPFEDLNGRVGGIIVASLYELEWCGPKR